MHPFIHSVCVSESASVTHRAVSDFSQTRMGNEYFDILFLIFLTQKQVDKHKIVAIVLLFHTLTLTMDLQHLSPNCIIMWNTTSYQN